LILVYQLLNWFIESIEGVSLPEFYSAVEFGIEFRKLFYPGDFVVDSLPCTNLGSAVKHLKESDLVRD
jgi:hypothetical protein